MPPKLRHKHNRRDIQLQHDDHATGGLTCLDDMTPDKLLATLPALTSADLMFKPILDKAMATAQLHGAFCINIRRHLNDGVVIQYGDNRDRIWYRQVTQDQNVIPYALKKNASSTPIIMQGWLDILMEETYTIPS